MKKRILSIFLSFALVFSQIPAVAFAADTGSSSSGTVYVGFTSDVHGNTTGLTSWFDSLPVPGGASNLQNMGYCGDYSYSNGTSYINDFKNIVSITNTKVGEGKGVYTAGNHCYSNVDGTNSALNSGFTSTPGYYRIGEAVNNNDYTIYCFGAASGDGTGSFNQSDITTLSNYLKTADTDEPIFILSHYPLHVNSWRTIGNASSVIDLLNNYPNVVFVWGHNHSQGDSHYGEIKSKGDSINYSSSSSKTINFTYLSAGGMKDGNSGVGKYYGMVAGVAKDGSGVTYTYYNTSGANQGSKTVSLDGTSSGGSGSGTVTPEPETPIETVGEISVTPEQGGTTYGKTVSIAKGENVTVHVTNGSSNSSYDFTTKFSKSGIASANPASVNISAGATGDVVLTGLSEGSTQVTISNGNTQYGSSYERTVTINLTVTGEGGGTSGGTTPETPGVSAKEISVTPQQGGETYGDNVTIAKGDSVTVHVTNGSSSQNYTFKTTVKNSGIASASPASVTINKGATADVVLTGLAAGTTQVTITNEGSQSQSQYIRTETINLTVTDSGSGSGGSTEPETPSTGSAVYQLTDKFELGNKYLIVTTNSGSGVALANNSSSSFATANVTVTDNKIAADSVPAAAVWEAKETGTTAGLIGLYNGSNVLKVDASNTNSPYIKTGDSKYSAGGFGYTSQNHISYPYGTNPKDYFIGSSNGAFTASNTENNLGKVYIYVLTEDGGGSGSGTVTPEPEDPTPSTGTVSVTPSTDKPEVNATIAVGDKLTVKVTNGSENNAYDFTATLSDGTVATITPDSQNIKKGETAEYTITGVKAGNTTITIKNNNQSSWWGSSSSQRVATINLTVTGEGGSTEPETPGVSVSEISVTPQQGGTTYKDAVTIAKGESVTVHVTNESERSSYTFTTKFDKSGIASADPASVEIAAGATKDVVITGVAEGTTKVTISNNNTQYGSQYERTVTINLTVTAGSTEHTHNTNGKVDHKDATCTETGVVGGTYCTECNDGKAAAEATIAALGHNSEGNVAHKDATCIEDGIQGGTYCTRCDNGKAAAEATIAKLGHAIVNHEAQAPTCTEKGWDAYQTCSRCDYSTYAEKDALGHNKDGKIDGKEATCTEPGIKSGTYCTRCEYDKADAQQVVPALGHNTEGTVEHKDATCTEDGVQGGTYCSRCENGKAAAEAVIKAAGHSIEKHAAQAPTCTEIGWDAYEACTKCDYTTYKEIAAAGHAWGEPEYNWSVDSLACIATRACTVDGCTEVETEEGKVTVTEEPATETEDGVRIYTAAFDNDAFKVKPKFEIIKAQGTDAKPELTYQAHVQNYGWTGWVAEGEEAGTTGESLRVEALEMKLTNETGLEGGIAYRAHVQNDGWQQEQTLYADGTLGRMGTWGESKRVEAIELRLTGELAEQYSIYYRTHAQDVGWTTWVKDGAMSGTAGLSKRLESIQVKIVKKGSPEEQAIIDEILKSNAPGSIDTSSAGVNAVTYYAKMHVQDYGDIEYPAASGAEALGTTGESKRVEAITLLPENGVTLEYCTHIQDYGWQAWRQQGEMSGTQGESKRLEAISIRLTGDSADQYDVYYRTHIQNIGWTGWAKNGQDCGSAGFSYRMEAMQIVIVPKGGTAPGMNEGYFFQA